MLNQATNEIVTKLTAEIFTATSLLKRELPGEILGAMEALETFKNYEEKKNAPADEEDILDFMRRFAKERRVSSGS